MPYQQTSYSNAAGTTVVNQDQDVYNGVGQLTGEYQSVSGAVDTSTTPEVPSMDIPASPTGSNLVTMIYPNGRILHYGYDNNALDTAIGRVDYVADDNGSGAAGSHLVDYSYQGLNTFVGQADGNGVTLTETVDPFGRIAEMNWLNIAPSTSTDDFQYGYDRNGNVLYKNNNLLDSSFSELYHSNSTTSGDNNSAYDPLNRLTGFSQGTLTSSGNNGSTTRYRHQREPQHVGRVKPVLLAAGRRWEPDFRHHRRNGNDSPPQNSQNELTGVGSSTLTYDNDGNTTTDENGNTLTYDAWNRLKTDSAGTTSYAYDANGRRIQQEAQSSVTTTFYLSTQDQVLEERQGSTVTAQNVWSIDYVNDLLFRDDNSTNGSLGISGSGLGTRLYAQHDANFNITAMVDTGGNVADRYIYTPFGVQTVLASTWAISGDADSVYGFQGGRYDIATGMNHFDARDYDPATGMWIEKDPAGDVDGANYYRADDDDPISRLDPVLVVTLASAVIPQLGPHSIRTMAASWRSSMTSKKWGGRSHTTC